MGYKKKAKETEGGYFPETIPACYFEDGKFIVPTEWEEYYLGVWAWKRSRLSTLEQHKRRYLEEYEAKNGAVTKWRDHTGLMRQL